jgi:hypothetical protein
MHVREYQCVARQYAFDARLRVARHDVFIDDLREFGGHGEDKTGIEVDSRGNGELYKRSIEIAVSWGKWSVERC